MRLAAICLLLPLAGLAADVSGLRVAGKVVNSVTGAPVPGARVGLEKSRSEDQVVSVYSGADGRFVFADVPAGMYALHGERRGYRTTHLGQGLMGGGIAIAVAAGEQNDRIVFPLPPGSAIGGRVLDEAGEPVTEALVQLLASTCAGGRRRTVRAGYRWTNDLGEYRFSGLAQGTYYLAVTATPWYAGKVAGAAFAPQYYGGVSDSSSAAPLPLKEGEEANANFTLAPTTGVTVKLMVPQPGTFLLGLTAPGIGTNDLWLRNQQAAGMLEIRGVPPGRYWASGFSPRGEPAFARQRVDVGGADLEVKLEPETPLVVSGKLQFPGGRSDGAERVRVLLTNEEKQTGAERAPGPGGIFAFDQLAAARYKVTLLSQERVYIGKLTADGATLDGDTLDLTQAAGTVHLSIDARDDGGRLQGKVRKGEQPAAGALVLLVPQQDSAALTDYHLFMSDSDGSFDFIGIRPGEYALFAADIPELEYTNPEAIRPYRKGATQLKVEANSRQTENLSLP